MVLEGVGLFPRRPSFSLRLLAAVVVVAVLGAAAAAAAVVVVVAVAAAALRFPPLAGSSSSLLLATTRFGLTREGREGKREGKEGRRGEGTEDPPGVGRSMPPGIRQTPAGLSQIFIMLVLDKHSGSMLPNSHWGLQSLSSMQSTHLPGLV